MSISSSKLLGDLTFHGIYFLFKRDLASPLPRFPRREKKILEDSRKSTINFHPGEEEKRNLISLFLIQLLRKILRFHPTSNYYQPRHKFSLQLERSSIIDRATGNVGKEKSNKPLLSLSLFLSRERRMSLPPLFLRRFATIYKLRDKSHLRRRQERGPRCDSPSHNYGAGRRRRRRRRRRRVDTQHVTSRRDKRKIFFLSFFFVFARLNVS